MARGIPGKDGQRENEERRLYLTTSNPLTKLHSRWPVIWASLPRQAPQRRWFYCSIHCAVGVYVTLPMAYVIFAYNLWIRQQQSEGLKSEFVTEMEVLSKF